MGINTVSHIRLYRSVEEFNSAYTGDEYIEPWVSLCLENSGVSFNKTWYDKLIGVPLTFNIISGGTIEYGLSNGNISYAKTIEYSVNGGEWTSFTPTENVRFVEIPVNAGDTIQFRGDNAGYSGEYEEEGETYMYINCFLPGENNPPLYTIEGNIMSLVNSTGFSAVTELTQAFAFYNLFYNCETLISAKNLRLPATTLANYCYESMFEYCTSLTTPPELPATALTDGCYNSMFYNCTSLTTAPALPATALTERCYGSMFSKCTSLVTAPSLPATTLANYCYQQMFNGCASLTTVPADYLPATTLATYCYQGMFNGCTSLTTAPELPATTLTTYCYQNMFNGCTSLTTAPALPATTLANYCYQQMFRNCTSLNYIKCLATNISASNCTTNWVNGVAASGTFVKNPNMTGWTTSTSGIPSGWTVQDAS